MDTPFEWLKDFEQVLTDYNEGQKENNASHNTYFAGRTGTGKGQLSGWVKEHGMATDNAKIIDVHATEPAHLEELFQFMFPNGFLLNQDAIDIVEGVKRELKKESYRDPVLSTEDIDELLELLENGSPPERIEKIDEFLDEEDNWSLRQRLKEAREKQVEIRDRLQQIHEWVYTNPDIPDTFRKAYKDGLNRSFDVEVFVPISDSMPTCPVPDFFTPFAIPVDDFAQHPQMKWGLQIVHGDTKYQEYRKTYMKATGGIDGKVGLEDLKNVEGLDEEEFVETGYYGDDQRFQVTEVEVEGQSLEAFQRDWASMFGTHGVVCSSDFEHRLRPKLKQALLEDEPDMIVVYTGFLNSEALRNFVITHFLETYEDIIQNLEPKELKKIDRKFIVSGIEAQEWVKKASSKEEKTFVEDRVVVRQLSKMMDNCRHFNTDFWFDMKPDKAHPIILSKASDRFVTSMNEGDVDRFSSWDTEFRRKYKKNVVKDRNYNNLDKRYPEFGYGFIYIEANSSVPEWKRNGRTNYGHRLPCPRMCVQDPVDRFSANDFSFFTEELDRWDTISFQEYQDALFKEDWEQSAEPYIEEARRQKKKEKEEEQKEKMEKSELRKKTAQALLKEKVRERGGVPDAWSRIHSEIKSEMIDEGLIPEDFSDKQIQKYTKPVRDDLEQNFDPGGGIDVGEVAGELKKMTRFVFTATSKDDKIYLAKKHVKEEYEVGDKVAESVGEEAAREAWMDLKAEGIIDQQHQPDLEGGKEEFRELMGLDVPDEEVEEASSPSESKEDGDEEDLESPGEEWRCSCGAHNEGDRSVCRSCGKSHEEGREEG